MIEFSIPLHTHVGKKKVNLNLNEYRNLHYQVLNKAKKNIELLVLLALRGQETLNPPVMVTITFYKEGRRKRDLSNVCCIADKFVLDAIVKSGLIPDDDCNTIPLVGYVYGGIDRENPRMDIKIETCST